MPSPPPAPNVRIQIPASAAQEGDVVELDCGQVLTAIRVEDRYGNAIGMDEEGNRVVYFQTEDGQQVTLKWPLNALQEPMVWKRTPTPG